VKICPKSSEIFNIGKPVEKFKTFECFRSYEFNMRSEIEFSIKYDTKVFVMV